MRHGYWLAISVFLAVACGEGGSGPSVPVATVVINGVTGALTPNQNLQLTVTLWDADGNPLSGRSVNWTSSPTTVASVNSTGLVTTVAVGSATVTAAVEGKSGTATITVVPASSAAVATVEITAPKTAFLVGETAGYAAILKDGQGNVLGGRIITWLSSAVAVASVASNGTVTALAAGDAVITATSEGVSATRSITVTGGATASLLEQRILAQQGLAIALASTVLQSQLYTLIVLEGGEATNCLAIPGGGAMKLITVPEAIPAQINYYFDAACTRVYMQETVTQFTADAGHVNFHIIANALYFGPTGTPLGSIAFDENANNIALVGGLITGTVNGLGTYTSLSGAPSVRLGLNCNFGAPGHNVGVCQGGIAQNFPGLNTALGSVATLALDTTNAGVVNFSGTSLLRSGPLNSLNLTQPTTTTMVVTGGSAYGNATAGGSAANFSLFPPTPTGWTVSDAANDMVFAITLTDNVTRTLSGTLKRISNGSTVATLALDQSGTGTITYSNGLMAAVTGWMLSQ